MPGRAGDRSWRHHHPSGLQSTSAGHQRVADPRQPGHRVWPRGIHKDALDLDLWLKEIAPSDALRKWFGQYDGYQAEVEVCPARSRRPSSPYGSTWRTGAARGCRCSCVPAKPCGRATGKSPWS
ncbi:MAG: DUF488 domain-containing protein [Acidimicrobiales bacterium]